MQIMKKIFSFREKDTSPVLWENEIAANRSVATITCVAVAISLILYALVMADVFYIPDTISVWISLGSILLMAVSAVLAHVFHYDKPWIKHMLLLDLVFSFAALYTIFTEDILFLPIIPMVISCMYFSRRFTGIVAAESLVFFSLGALFSANRGYIDLNNMVLFPGTVITIGESPWLIDNITDIPYDETAMIWNTLIYTVSINTAISVIVLYFCLKITDRGKKMLLRQQTLTEETVAVNKELSIASNIQTNMLPNVFPAFPERSELDIYACMHTAKEVGGDFYDFFWVDDDHLVMVVGDVSGKGVPASLFMMTSRTLIKTHARDFSRTPADILYATNADISEDNRENMFVTVWLGILEISSGTLTYADAGHERLLMRINGEWHFNDKRYSGVGIGMFDPEMLSMLPEKCQFVDQTLQLRPGDMILQYTDGVTEAEDAARELFGSKRLFDLCKEYSGDSPEELMTQIVNGMDEFVKDEPQADDITMLGLTYTGLKNI